ncbi:dipeptidyl aminopeptidase/acylaminoacyl peptidase [Pseudomonas hunanensis]|uniref:Dipeptidyl aminopeptidase/acylaminoacyl peptidase n=1 Tax=Pseudomonas hunanensis TaxID=1247546 RepID=A0ACC6K4D5_9PSED|nr:S9 family peptidase [Pseudomonas hunanensis]MDR6713331.1 dipeptidyl aminopeptidase/acylaminoacyl peptidase [Pseudomonas hunanensis]
MSETPVSSSAADFSAAQAVAAGTDFAELKVGASGVFWNEFRPADGACRIWQWRDEQAHCLTPDGFSVRSRVYEYGGGSFCLGGDGLVFVNEADQQVYTQALDGSPPRPLTHADDCRYGDVLWRDGQVLAVEEQHGQSVSHRLVSLGGQGRQVLAEGADFYAAPTLSADGTRLAWIEWDRPEQPWTRTRLMARERDEHGDWNAARCLAGDGSQQLSLQQPRFDEQARLYCLSDQNGFWQPWGEIDGQWQALPATPADHAAAPWQLGASSWIALGPRRYLASWFEEGFGLLGLRNEDQLQQYAGEYTRFRSLALDDRHLYAIAASPVSPPAVIAIDRVNQQIALLAGGGAPLPAERVSRPQPIRYPSGDAHAHGFFYPAMNSAGPSPLVLFIHGGPTSACYPVLDARIQYWTQRGFAVADLNYRGSTGYGRDYRQALHLRWGETDVEDACAAVAHLAGLGLIDPGKAFIRGGSAGGYTTLCALAFHDVFRAGASLYGVSDPLALTRSTHKFEGDYLDWLIGDPERDTERYRQRTPLLHAEQIKVPVIFFQGELDAVVVPEQTREMLAALQANGIEAAGHFYAGERHGFRKAENLAHALEEEWKFYCRVLDR